MAVDQTLMDFVVRLATEADFRQNFNVEANREQMMTAAKLTEKAKGALRKSDKVVVEQLLNTQVATAGQPE